MSSSRLVLDYPSTFPIQRRPVFHVPTVRMNWKTSPGSLLLWHARIDQLIQPRLDRKGIIHTVSYPRAEAIYARSKFQKYMILHKPGSIETMAAVKEHRRRKGASILLSPAVTTGLDFPYRQCEYQIIPKLPFHPMLTKLLKYRCQEDKDYAPYLCAQALVQSVGRGMRAPDDQCETFVIDDNFRWFVRTYARFLPGWFYRSIVWTKFAPKPLPKLRLVA